MATLPFHNTLAPIIWVGTGVGGSLPILPKNWNFFNKLLNKKKTIGFR